MSKPSEPGAANLGGLAGVGMKVIHGNKYNTQQSQGQNQPVAADLLS